MDEFDEFWSLSDDYTELEDDLASDYDPDENDDFWDFYDDYMALEDDQPSGGCYLATCAYGSYDCPEVWVLRRFRDSFLKSFSLGRWFIRIYYATSPLLVSALGKNRFFRHSVKAILTPLILFLKWKGYVDSPYKD